MVIAGKWGDLGYHVDSDGIVYENNEPISHLGIRKAILNDLSPAAALISYNYNVPANVERFIEEAERILEEAKKDIGWMYETSHPHCEHPDRKKGQINFTVWSDVFVCPNCSEDLVLWEVAVDKKSRKVKSDFICPTCQSRQTKSSLERAHEMVFNPNRGETVTKAKRVPVLINYSVGKQRYEKKPDAEDLMIIQRIQKQGTPYWFPKQEINKDLDLWYERDYRALGIFSIDDFYTSRNLHMTAYLWHRVRQVPDKRLRNLLIVWVQSVTMGFSLLNRFLSNAYSQVNRILSGTLYVGSFISEVSPWYALRGKIRSIAKMPIGARPGSAAISTCSISAKTLPDESIDYIFVDPPFGSNIIYSDLSIVWESWLKLHTNVQQEAVIHRRKKEGNKLADYQGMMETAFAALFAALKPGRWMTVEFHNTQNAVWNSIQEAIWRAGFIVADVRTLDKKMATFKQVTASGAVKQDLVISAYKAQTSFEQQFLKEAGNPESAWEFVSQHLAHLPVVIEEDGVIESLSERQDYLLFDRMVAFHIQRGTAVPLSASEFYAGLRQRFIERDGMFFLPEQVPEYDMVRMQAQAIAQLTLFVTDEKSGIQWLRQQLNADWGGHPQTYQDIQPRFLKQLHQLRHEILPELSVILEQNFLQDEEGRWYVPDPNKASDLEKLRHRALIREFDTYRTGNKKLKQFRTEAIRVGFAQSWSQKEYATIVQMANRLPDKVVQEDPDLLMYYDNASLMVGS